MRIILLYRGNAKTKARYNILLALIPEGWLFESSSRRQNDSLVYNF